MTLYTTDYLEYYLTLVAWVVNNGIWKELEEQTRDWTYQNDEVYIVSGPIFEGPIKYIKNKVAVPTAFYKIILDIKDQKR